MVAAGDIDIVHVQLQQTGQIAYVRAKKFPAYSISSFQYRHFLQFLFSARHTFSATYIEIFSFKDVRNNKRHFFLVRHTFNSFSPFVSNNSFQVSGDENSQKYQNLRIAIIRRNSVKFALKWLSTACILVWY